MSDLFKDKNISPMLMYETTAFSDKNYIFELKLDGIRCIAYIDTKSVVLQNKRFKDVTAIYPELASMYKCVVNRCVLDGELISLKNGKPDFYGIQKRSLMTDKFKISMAARKNPVQFVAYDILYIGKKDITDLPLTERKKLLNKNVKDGNNLSISRYVEEKGEEFFELVKEQNLEGIVAKKKDGRYYIGKRTREWVKIKVMQDEDLYIFGYQPDSGGNVKDLILGFFDKDGTAVCRGKVFLGVSSEDRKLVAQYALNNRVSTPWFSQYKNAVWLKPGLKGTAHFMQQTPSGSMRQPVWKGLRDDI
ncbi:MAG: ATP-dependent DNA ligase [Clostridia bacterium]|nr:ATP-dependent DNA ligase [Clostridia bacterium]